MAPGPAGFGNSPNLIVSNNNPGALRVPGSMAFQSFDTPQAGIQGQESLLNRRYFGRGLNSVARHRGNVSTSNEPEAATTPTRR